MSEKNLRQLAAIVYLVLSVFYIAVTLAGFMTLPSPDDPIGNPWFTLMEMLIILIAPALVWIMTAVLRYAPESRKHLGIAALVFMAMTANITSSVHFVILTVKEPFEASGYLFTKFIFSFTWPSMVYALDILAWDLFFALSMITAAFVFRGPGPERATRRLMLLSGILSLAGLAGVPLSNMMIRNIGVIGYAIVAPMAVSALLVVFQKGEANRV